MEKHKFSISISGTPAEAKEKATALAVIGAHLTTDTLLALARVVRDEPHKVDIAKRFLGL